METTHELTGFVDRFLYQNTENGFCVLILTLKHKQTVTVRGHMPSIQPGERVTLKGSWVTHPKFGKQFEAQQCAVSAPTSIVGLKKYLGSGLIKGIGPVYAEKLVAAFGVDVLEVIDTEPERLASVPGIGKKRIETIIHAWKDQKEISSIMVFLQEKGISTAYATKIYKKYGHNSIAVLKENPYRLADEIWGIGFKLADTIAQNMGIAKDSLQRVKSGILYAIKQIIGNGHLYAEMTQLKKETIKLLELDAQTIEPTIKHALHDLYHDEKIKVITQEDKHYATLTRYYVSERGVAQKIKNLLTHTKISGIDIEKTYQSLRVPKHANDLLLNEEQQQGILTVLQNKITVITGGPGTGKTTLIKKLLDILDDNKLSYKLAAPTGRAAKRITEGTRRHALTLHRLLEFDVSTFGFSKNEQNALQLDLLIIDEASMIDVFLAHAIVKALPYNAHLVLIGDVNQLPSVGAGNILNDIIASKTVACVQLKKIFRQAKDSLIIVNAHRINHGDFPVSSLPNAKKDFIFIKENDPQNIRAHLHSLFSNKLKRYGIKPKDATVLVPMNRGVVGTHNLNHELQNILNPHNTEKAISYGAYTFKENDRVMQIRNNYDKNVFNGDMGTIADLDPKDKKIAVQYPDKLVEYESNELDELVLAYAISIHKSQGSEYSAAIIPIFMQHFMLLQRNLVYTAITRAKQLCICIGQPKAWAMAIKNNKGLVRKTFLKEFLTSELKCR